MQLSHIHSLRGIAIIFIVFGHALFFQFDWDNNTETLNTLKDILTNGTIMFVFVAGYLFQYKLEKFHWGKYIKNKFYHVISPYIIVSLPAIIYAFWFSNPSQPFPQIAEWNTSMQVLWYYMVGGAHVNYSLWFIPMIVLFFIGAPLFAWISRNPVSYLTLIPLYMLSFAIHREPFPNLDILRNALFFLPIYMTGMLACQYRATFDPLLTRYLGIVFALFAGILIIQIGINSYHGVYHTTVPFIFPRGYIDWLLLQKIILCFLIMGLFMKYPNLSNRTLNYLASISFTIFFFHVYFYFSFNVLLGYQTFEGTLGNWFLRGSASLFLCVLTAWAGKKILGKHSRAVIGY